MPGGILSFCYIPIFIYNFSVCLHSTKKRAYLLDYIALLSLIIVISQ